MGQNPDAGNDPFAHAMAGASVAADYYHYNDWHYYHYYYCNVEDLNSFGFRLSLARHKPVG